jgi:hypothetical protein
LFASVTNKTENSESAPVSVKEFVSRVIYVIMPIILIYIDLINDLPYELFSKCDAKKGVLF